MRSSEELFKNINASPPHPQHTHLEGFNQKAWGGAGNVCRYGWEPIVAESKEKEVVRRQEIEEPQRRETIVPGPAKIAKLEVKDAQSLLMVQWGECK